MTTKLNYLHGLKHVNGSAIICSSGEDFCWLEHSIHTNKGIPLKIVSLLVICSTIIIKFCKDYLGFLLRITGKFWRNNRIE